MIERNMTAGLFLVFCNLQITLVLDTEIDLQLYYFFAWFLKTFACSEKDAGKSQFESKIWLDSYTGKL